MAVRTEEITSLLRQQIEGFSAAATDVGVGTVIEAGDGIARIHGLSNALVSEPGERGVQSQVLEEGTYYKNPYVERIDMVDCRSKRFDLSQGDEMGFPSKDGFWITVDGVVEFRVEPEKAAELFVLYNDVENDDATGAPAPANSRSAACCGVSSVSTWPLGSSRVKRSTAGRYCRTRTRFWSPVMATTET